ncbi:transcriptional regulator, TetR family [Enhydrobacter aerosaccus]|uniref:Transcriptional regulator, TetR family n=1 Tax=Enhydrobacter aerosaccus TaxID=225324 RepID=A0A1T4P922_9HYPH|nr:helix-turn-helix domain-containing protein [Enhydrobacter aerosaccus]SJZ88033.1 transcriptional regulator, TetR family [Enhydrobacter aerosaccus]
MTVESDRALEAFLRLIGEKGFEAATLRDVAEASGLGLAELHRVHPDKVSLIRAFMARIDAEVLGGAPKQRDPEETARDRLFDVMMRRYDSLRPHREAVRAIRRAARRDPILALALGPVFARSMAAMLEAAALPSEGLAGLVRQHGLLAIHYDVSRVFDQDDTMDLSKTMAALDNRLKTAERWAQPFERFASSAQRDDRRPLAP